MSRKRHEMKKASGGGLSSKPAWNAGEEQNTAKEAEELKRGGAAKRMHGEGEKAKERADRPKRARGGKVDHGVEHIKHHSMAHMKRANGGRLRGEGIGADRTPLTTAAKIKMITPGEIGEDAKKSD